MDIRGLKVSETLPDGDIVLLLVEPDLNVVLVDFVAEQEDLLATGHWTGSLCQSTYREVTFGFCNKIFASVSSPPTISQSGKNIFPVLKQTLAR